MSSMGGPLIEVSIKGRVFAVSSEADTTLTLGGSENETKSNGNQTVRLIKTVAPWKLEGVDVDCDNTAGDLEFLQDAADGNSLFPITWTYPSGAVYQATGQITGAVGYSSANALASVSLSGGGKATPQ